jgi:hypothetical protein
LTRILLSHLFKGYARSSSVGKDITLQIVLGFIVVALMGYSLVLGFALERIIVNTLKQQDAIAFLNGLLLYYSLGEFITRYFWQSFPAIDARPYLHLPIPRSSIANFLIEKSFVHLINILVFVLFMPFAFGPVADVYGIGHAWAWLLSLWFLSLINHFAVVLVKKNVAEHAWRFFAFIVIGTLVACADHFGWFKLSQLSQELFNSVLKEYTVTLTLFLLVVLSYYIVYRTLLSKMYLEEAGVQDKETFHSGNWEFLQRFGLVGAWAKLELKLILRNKRSRELFIMNIVFFLLPLGFFSNAKDPEAYGTFLFFAMVSSGFFTMNYGQFLFSWQAGHFDFTLIQPTSIRQFVESKFWLLGSIVAVWFLSSIPYIFLAWHFLLITLAASLYNIGINSFVVMNMSLWGVKKIDLKHSGSLNFEGIGAAQWLMGIPLIVGPYIFYIPVRLMGYPILGLVAVGLAGLIGILFRDVNIDFTTRRLLNKRHQLASNFRKD